MSVLGAAVLVLLIFFPVLSTFLPRLIYG